MKGKTKKIVLWIVQIIVALILLQTLFFKFTGAEEAKYIFSTIGIEPWGRYLVGILELIAGILLFTNWALYGAILALIISVGAIFSHLTILGVEVMGDNGLLFGMAIVVAILSIFVIAMRWKKKK